MPPLQTLIGQGCAVVVGLPKGFRLLEALRSATEIRLATAFAHKSGWDCLRTGVTESSADVFLLTGIEFNQTEPAVLKAWLQLKLSRGDKVNVNLASGTAFFHPKVLIVCSAQMAFAVVGSGNLSKGGLQTNCECSVFIDDGSTVAELCTWFDSQFKDGTPLISQVIKAYEPEYDRARAKRAELEREQKRTQNKLKAVGEASMASWNRALNMAEGYFRSDIFEKRYLSHVEASKRLLHYLDGPKFEFDRTGWDSFYNVPELGRLDPRYRDKVYKAGKRLRQACRELVKKPLETIPAVLHKTGRLRIKGFGVNTASKILAASRPSEWPVYNSRVAKALADFGYKIPHGVGADGRYIAFRNAMKKFMDACKQRGLSQVDAISLDAFFYDRSKDLGY